MAPWCRNMSDLAFNMKCVSWFVVYCILLSSFLWLIYWTLVSRKLSRYSDSLRAGRSGDRIPVWMRYFAPVQTGPGTHSASYRYWTFPGGKAAEAWRWTLTPSSAEFKEWEQLYPISPSGSLWTALVWNFPLTLRLICWTLSPCSSFIISRGILPQSLHKTTGVR